jgi:hypothetical protein
MAYTFKRKLEDGTPPTRVRSERPYPTGTLGTAFCWAETRAFAWSKPGPEPTG